jgi:hypothetical protein
MISDYLLWKISRMALAGLLAAFVLGAMVDKVLSGKRSVVVHVAEPDVEVRIDDATYPIVGMVYDPIECQLSPGTHRLVMSRGLEVLLDEPFVVERGHDLVLTAWKGRRP